MKSKRVLITGAGSGIGKAAAFALACRGHSVTAGTHTQAQSEAIAQEAHEAGILLKTLVLDITSETDRTTAARQPFDVLVNNAAVGETGPLAEVPMERVRACFETNVFSTLALTQLMIAPMLERGTGTVLFVSSLAGRAPMPFLNPYSMTKFALSGGVAALRDEVREIAPDVHVSLIEPGAYATGFNQRMFEKKYEWLDASSHFFKLIPTLKGREKRFERLEQQSTDSIVRAIVRAAEAEKPRLRYVAPGYQGLGVYLLRLLGA